MWFVTLHLTTAVTKTASQLKYYSLKTKISLLLTTDISFKFQNVKIKIQALKILKTVSLCLKNRFPNVPSVFFIITLKRFKKSLGIVPINPR